MDMLKVSKVWVFMVVLDHLISSTKCFFKLVISIQIILLL